VDKNEDKYIINKKNKSKEKSNIKQQKEKENNEKGKEVQK
jgi:hypothetical protein